MSAEKWLHEAQYAFLCISSGDTRENRKHAARATSYAKKIIRKYPTSSEARQANDLLIRLGDEHYSHKPSKLSKRHRHKTTEPKHDHSDLRAPETHRQSLEGISDQPIAWSSLWSAAMGLNVSYLLIALGMAFLFVMLFGFFLPIALFVLFAFLRSSRKRHTPEAEADVNRAKHYIHTWMMNNQR